MENKFDLMRAAMSEARQTMRAADNQANAMADMLDGRLRKVNPRYLAKLKKQLKDFNAHTGRWKN